MYRLPAVLLISLLFSVLQPVLSQVDVNKPWNAQWIAAPGDDGTSYGVFYFRKTISLAAKPNAFVVHVSADNRYKLYVNDSLISLGPARGDLAHWNYETIDLSPYLVAGKNVVAAMVYNEAQYRPEAQITFRTAFILQGHSDKEEILNTDRSWKSIRDSSFLPIPEFYFAASTGQLVRMQHAVTGWQNRNFDDSGWKDASQLLEGKQKGQSDGFGWMLVPSPLPQMEMTYQRISSLRKAEGMAVNNGFPATKKTLVIPAHSTVTLLLDQTYLTNAYLTLLYSRGTNAGISLRYAESLFDNIAKHGMRKSNRNEVEGKDFSGRKDSLVSDGKDGQSFTSLNFRTFRYIQLSVHTQNEPLQIDDIYGTYTAYPFQQKAVFIGGDTGIQNILNSGWRTCRLNAVETYTDCPYYEQLQYIGDTRIQAMVSYYYSGDDRLARHAINLMDASRFAEGVTMSRYPTHTTQIISTFSLWYIGMLHDYWMYRNDSLFVKEKLQGARAVLDFFSHYQQPDGSLKNTPYWTFVDWANGKNWFVGSPPKGEDGSSAIIDLQLLWAYQWAAAMEDKLGLPVFEKSYRDKAAQLKQTIRHKYWDEGKQLLADTKEKNMFSQHANSLAILTGLLDETEQKSVCQKLLSDSTLTQCTIYFKYYLHMALVKGGLGDGYSSWLDVWRDNLKMGLTTWAEVSDLANTRSDCHAWGSSPNIEYFRTVLGIDSDAPGFTQIRIEPHLGTLTSAGGEMPHPEGTIKVSYKLTRNKWNIAIVLPLHTKGNLLFRGATYALQEGSNELVIPN